MPKQKQPQSEQHIFIECWIAYIEHKIERDDIEKIFRKTFTCLYERAKKLKLPTSRKKTYNIDFEYLKSLGNVIKI